MSMMLRAGTCPAVSFDPAADPEYTAELVAEYGPDAGKLKLCGEVVYWEPASEVILDYVGPMPALEAVADRGGMVWKCYGCGAWGTRAGFIDPSWR